MKRRLKINGAISAFAFLLMVAFPTVFFRNEKAGSLDTVTEVFGIAFILLGQVIRVSARGYKSERSDNGRVLIQDGPYALVRHPMYLGIFFIGIGIVLMLFKWWVVSIFLFVFIMRYILLIFKEEKKLLAIFPKVYQSYQQRVPRIMPACKMLLQKEISEYLPLKLNWLYKEIGSILTVLFLTLLLESWEDIRNEGIKAYFKEATGILFIIILFICLVYYLSKRTVKLEKYVSNKSEATL